MYEADCLDYYWSLIHTGVVLHSWAIALNPLFQSSAWLLVVWLTCYVENNIQVLHLYGTFLV